jgi:Peptidase family S41
LQQGATDSKIFCSQKHHEVSSKDLIKHMLPYMPADGINQTFKYYSLCNYFYFHYLFNLFYPNKKGINFQIENSKTHYYIQLLPAKAIDSIYFTKSHKSISEYGKQLGYEANRKDEIAYLRVTSFYKGLIENFNQNYEKFLDSAFADIKEKGKSKLIIDVRDNEGGGDNYENILFSYLNEEPFTTNERMSVAGRTFKYKQFAGNSSTGVKMLMES